MTLWTFIGRQWTRLPPPPKGEYLKGKVVLITGANSGIGLESVKHFCTASPALLILAVRSIEASERVLAELQSLHTDLKGEVISLDLNEMESIKSLPSRLRERGIETIDILINNAGINPGNEAKPAEITKDGYEKTFQTNVLAPVLLSYTLLPFLKQTSSPLIKSKPKIIFLGSGLHATCNNQPIVDAVEREQSIVEIFNREEGFDNKQIYGRSKLLLHMFTRQLIETLVDTSIITVSPGLAITNLGRDFKMSIGFVIFGAPFMLLNARSAEKGARNLTSAVASAEQSYDYWAECGPSYSESSWLSSGQGVRASKAFYKEMIDEIEKISPGVTKAVVAS
ncbi:uncharacterized protein I303_107274 [Kwoniella dejecticola CBS 10117]|uniref:NAD(P)-binding protein n=1 Tax=Kwoniella dejecticola CBS 10117 TaxID=1296121 RepID=A0A1A5ZZ81_9TREE|nr:uncharacterized protein I303_06676 [Kwoniella dejecticola CBS 10117]OBR83117.1 hypothetical protein I303_06676 [Kwoniella dejecticola CBS 10117]